MTEFISSGIAGSADSAQQATISGDGRIVAFRGDHDLFLFDRDTGETTIVEDGNIIQSFPPALSADGRFAVFVTTTAYDANDTNADFAPSFGQDVYVYDRLANRFERVSVDSAGNQVTDGASFANLSISADGRYVSFESGTRQLGLDVSGVYIHDRQTGQTLPASTTLAGDPPRFQGSLNTYASSPSLSADGSRVAFMTQSDNLVDFDSAGGIAVADIGIDPDSGGLTFEWDLDYDGNNFDVDVTGESPLVSFDDNFAERTIALRVTDSGGLSHIATSTLSVSNADPVVDAGEDQEGSVSSEFDFEGSFSDPGTADTHTFAWDFGDGTTNDNTLSPTHSYSETGTFTVRLTVTDDDGGTSFDELTVTVDDSGPVLQLDLNSATSVTEAGWVGLGSANTYDADRGYGWLASAIVFDRTSPTDLLQDGHLGTDNIFRVDLPDGDYFVNVTMGDSAAARDLVDVYAEGALVLDNVTTPINQFVHRSFPVTVTGNQLSLRFDDDGFDPFFSLNGIEVLPSQLTHTLTLAASGTVVSGSGATPGSLITVSTSHGTIASTTFDVDPNYAGVQVVALSDGTFGFDLTEPLTPGVATITSEETTGQGSGSTTFTYAGASEWHFDLDGTGSPTAAGFIGVGAGTGNEYSAAQGYGWLTAALTASGSGTDLLRDRHLGTDNTFLVDLANGSYVANVTLGDAAARDLVDVYVEGTLVLDDVTTAAGQYAHRSFPVTISDGQLTLRFDDDGFDPFFSVNAIEILPSQLTHTLTPNGDGTTVSGSGATPGSLVTVSTSLGSIAGPTPDDDPNYAGVQVTASGTGTFSFDITAPVTGGTATITSEEVTGLGISSTTFAYAGLGPAVQICDNEDGCFSAPTFTLRTTWGFQGDTRFVFGDSSGDTAAWTFTVDPGFEYRVSAYWQSDTKNRATNAPYEIFDGTTSGTSLGTVAVNQRVPTTDVVYTRVLDSGVWFADLGGPYTINSSTLTLTLDDDANDYVIADAIRIERLPALRAETAVRKDAAVETLTLDAAAGVVDLGRAAWSAADVTANARLAGVEVIVTDLPGKVLGLASEVSKTIWLDTNAAGHGWNISPHWGRPAADAVHLLSVISHELGHVLGLPDLDPTTHAGNVMASRLMTGERRLPLEADALSLTALQISPGCGGRIDTTGGRVVRWWFMVGVAGSTHTTEAHQQG